MLIYICTSEDHVGSGNCLTILDSFSPQQDNPNANLQWMTCAILFNNFHDSIHLEYPPFKGEKNDELKLNLMCLLLSFLYLSTLLLLPLASQEAKIRLNSLSPSAIYPCICRGPGYLEEAFASPTSLTGDGILLFLSASDIVSSPGDHGLSARAPTSCMQCFLSSGVLHSCSAAAVPHLPPRPPHDVITFSMNSGRILMSGAPSEPVTYSNGDAAPPARGTFAAEDDGESLASVAAVSAWLQEKRAAGSTKQVRPATRRSHGDSAGTGRPTKKESPAQTRCWSGSSAMTSPAVTDRRSSAILADPPQNTSLAASPCAAPGHRQGERPLPMGEGGCLDTEASRSCEGEGL